MFRQPEIHLINATEGQKINPTIKTDKIQSQLKFLF